MAKVAFIGRDPLSYLFRALGLEVFVVSEDTLQFNLGDYQVLFVEDCLYEDLRVRYPHKIVVPLVDFSKRRQVLIRRIEEFIRDTVGEEILKK